MSLYLHVENNICIFQKLSPYANTNKFVDVSHIHTNTSLIYTDQSKVHSFFSFISVDILSMNT